MFVAPGVAGKFEGTAGVLVVGVVRRNKCYPLAADAEVEGMFAGVAVGRLVAGVGIVGRFVELLAALVQRVLMESSEAVDG